MSRTLVALLSSLAAAAPASAPAAAEPAAAPPAAVPARCDLACVEELVAKARRLALASDRAWLRLGRWRPSLRGFRSEADGPGFFLAGRGKVDPAAELEATLRAIAAARPGADELEDARCRFPARFEFLASRLGLDPARLPPRRCPKLDEYLERLSARSVTLVFSSYYLKSAASAFGHTFLRVNKADGPRPGKAYELLDWGVNYSATVNTKNPLVYAARGLFGLFPGRFNHYAYYYKVREYSDAESRDLWEYDLALTPGEVSMLALHLYELTFTWFDYFYVDENCSYHVLGALEAAAPRLDLLRHVGWSVVVPADTVKALFRNPGLVRAIHYRPSIRTQFEARVSALDSAGVRMVEALSEDPAAPFPAALPPGARAAALDAAADLLDLRHARDLAVGAAPEAARSRQVLLERRSAIPVQSPPLEMAPPVERAPERGHGSTRAGAGAGWSSRGGALALVDLRVVLHDLADPPDGYPPLAQLEFLPVRLRYLSREGRVEVDEAWLARTSLLGDASRFDLGPSWRLRAGAATVRDSACRECLAAQAEFGSGFGSAGILGALDLYGGADVSVEWSPGLDGTDGRPVRAGVGPGAMVRLRAGRRATVLADARARWLPAASPAFTFDVRGTVRIHLVPGLSLSLEARRTPEAGEATGALLAYF